MISHLFQTMVTMTTYKQKHYESL